MAEKNERNDTGVKEADGFRPLRGEAIPGNDRQLRGDNRLLGDSMSNRQVCHGVQNEERKWHYPGDRERKNAYTRRTTGHSVSVSVMMRPLHLSFWQLFVQVNVHKSFCKTLQHTMWTLWRLIDVETKHINIQYICITSVYSEPWSLHIYCRSPNLTGYVTVHHSKNFRRLWRTCKP